MSLHACSDRQSLTYTSCYCEENIWKLCERVREQQPDQLDHCYAVFLSNSKEKIAVWGQRLGVKEKDYLVVWDYHVIMLHRHEHGTSVYDFDSILPFPSDFEAYCDNNFREDRLTAEYRYQFRVVPAAQLLQKFASDRSRMRDENGQYLMPPPSYECIRTATETNNLDSFIAMDASFPVGQVMDLTELRQTFGSKNNN